jgi:hypothetical protein
VRRRRAAARAASAAGVVAGTGRLGAATKTPERAVRVPSGASNWMPTFVGDG